MATTYADNLFGPRLKEIRRKLSHYDYAQSRDVRKAVISTMAYAVAQYLEGRDGMQYRHSGSSLRQPKMMEELRQELTKFFESDVKIRKNPNYPRGIIITVNF
jgi:hypothetical protein